MRLAFLPQRWSADLPATIILLFVVAGAPLPFGSTNDLSIAFWCLCLGAGLVLAPTRGLRRQHVYIIAGVFVIVAGYGLVLRETHRV